MRRTHKLSGTCPATLILMVDKADYPSTRPAKKRLQTLAQAALNADVTVGQVDELLGTLSERLADLNRSTDGLDATLARFNETITSIDELAPRLIAVVDRMEAIVSRVERIVGIGEAVISPLAVAENTVRGVVAAVRDRAHL